MKPDKRASAFQYPTALTYKSPSIFLQLPSWPLFLWCAWNLVYVLWGSQTILVESVRVQCKGNRKGEATDWRNGWIWCTHITPWGWWRIVQYRHSILPEQDHQTPMRELHHNTGRSYRVNTESIFHWRHYPALLRTGLSTIAKRTASKLFYLYSYQSYHWYSHSAAEILTLSLPA